MYIKKGYNTKSLKNLKPYYKGDKRCKVNGSVGGTISGKVRKRKAILKEKLLNYIEVEKEISILSETEFKDIINIYSKDKQELLRMIFKATKK